MSLDLSINSSRDLTLELCTFLTDLTLSDLPPDLIHMAKASILNSIGCGLSSSPSSLPSAAKLYRAIDTLSKTPRQATVLGMHERATLDDAALLNGMSMTARFYDDTHLSTLVHPSGPPLAAILAYAEVEGLSGQDVLLSFIVGVETGLSIAHALGLGPYKKGWHMTSIVGSFAAAAAVARLMKLDAQGMATALGHASSMSSGSRNVFATDTLIMHAGRAAQNGILAARLAREGFGSTTHAVEKWIKLISSTDEGTDVGRIADSLNAKHGGGSWLFMENAFKPYPCGIVIHPLIDAGIEAHAYFFPDGRKKPEDALDIFTRIEATVTPMTIRLCGVQQPKKFMDIIFSSHHGLAVGLVYGKGGIREYSEGVANDPLIVALRDRITLVPDEAVNDDQTWVKFWYVAVDGTEQVKEIRVEHALGSLENPMTDEQLNAKYKDQAIEGRLSEANIRESIAQCWAMDEITNIQTFMRLLVPAPESSP
jgi:aconitate decarboxylase